MFDNDIFDGFDVEDFGVLMGMAEDIAREERKIERIIKDLERTQEDEQERDQDDF